MREAALQRVGHFDLLASRKRQLPQPVSSRPQQANEIAFAEEQAALVLFDMEGREHGVLNSSIVNLCHLSFVIGHWLFVSFALGDK